MLQYHSTMGLSCLLVISVLHHLPYQIDSLTITSMLEGNKLRCNEEGQRVKLPFPQPDPCITCMCINSEVDCFKNSCAESLHCYHYQSNSSSSDCCRKCRVCSVGNRTLPNGSSMQNAADPCLSYHCSSGTLTQHKTQCYVPCKKPISLLGQCCPSCNACPRGHTADGQEVPGVHDDPCIRCYCFKGQMICTQRVCPVLPCSITNQIHPSHECCPICRGKGDSDRPLPIMSCIFENVIYGHLEEFRADPCTQCRCENGTNVCWRESCPQLTCTRNERIQEEGQCCAKCANGPRVRKEPHTECMHKSHRYKNGQQWKDGCHECTCRDGHPLCHLLDCPRNFVCPLGHRKVRLNGECCDTCIRDDGKCLATQGLSKITTFDGLPYTWNGHCNYVLARDCATKQFSVHSVHKFHNGSLRSEPIYRGFSLLVKLGPTRVYLSTLGRVRVNRTLVQLPYIHLTQFTIMHSGQMVKLRALMGLEIFWQVNQSVEIRVKSHFQNKTCGLCGNFNLDVKDEFRSKSSGQVTSLELFINSFKVGQNVLCPRTKPVLLRKMAAERKKSCKTATAKRICQWLQQKFPACRGSLTSEQVYQQCWKNVCSCHNDIECQCFALKHYIKSCISVDEPETSMNEFSCQVPKCPAGSEYKLCSVACKKTCHKRGESAECRRKECRSGCECIGNRVWHGGQCIPEVMCPVN